MTLLRLYTVALLFGVTNPLSAVESGDVDSPRSSEVKISAEVDLAITPPYVQGQSDATATFCLGLQLGQLLAATSTAP